MADCGQLQALLDDAIQNRKDMDNPFEFCNSFPDPVQCIKNLPAQKRAANQEIQDIRQNMFICSVLIGTWTINADSSQFSGEFAITSYDAAQPANMPNVEGEIGTPDAGGGSFDAGNFDARTNELWFEYPGVQYRGTVNLSARPPTIAGTYPGGTWAGQKL
jgi:hypothetical protein